MARRRTGGENQGLKYGTARAEAFYHRALSPKAKDRRRQRRKLARASRRNR